jgi:hypothetical protein
MFVLSQNHLDALSQAAWETFEDRMVDALRVRFPSEFASLGEDGIRRRVRGGAARAAEYQITGEGDVSQFIRLMFGIGPDFDRSGKTAWAGPILRNVNTPPSERLARVKEIARKQGLRTDS